MPVAKTLNYIIGAKDLHLKALHTNWYRSSFEYFGAKLYNDLPNEVKSTSSDSAFYKALLMQHSNQSWQPNRLNIA